MADRITGEDRPSDDLADRPSAGVAAFALAWARALGGTTFLPMTPHELQCFLGERTARLADALAAEPFQTRVADRVGVDLVAAHATCADALGRTIELLHRRLLADLGLSGARFRDRLAQLSGALAAGYARALRDRTLAEQESIRRASLAARQQAEQALRESEARSRYRATHDLLTGLPNRALFTTRLDAAVERARRNDARLGICFVNLDSFKMVNDVLGHPAGDLLLMSMADRLTRSAGDHLVARLGGDEFVILVERTRHAEDLIEVADAALTAIREPSLVHGQTIAVTASIGIVERLGAETTSGDLMRAADVTLTWAKASGKNGWKLFDPEHDEHEMNRYALSTAMPAALERGEFFLDYQPLRSLVDGGVHGVEALVRWRHPRLGILRPDRFIGLAEETGHIVALGGWVLGEACRAAREWLPLAPTAPFVSVNLAVHQVRGAGLVDEVTQLLDRAGLPPGQLQLEITESAMMTAGGEPVHALRTLSDLGVRIAIDDFGTGYSNLAYLRSLPVDELKLAGSFVAGLRSPADDPDSQVDERILATLVSLAHALGLTVTAEGVETAGQADRLRAIGCDAAQGWHFGRPAPASRIIELLR